MANGGHPKPAPQPEGAKPSESEKGGKAKPKTR